MIVAMSPEGGTMIFMSRTQRYMAIMSRVMVGATTNTDNPKTGQRGESLAIIPPSREDNPGLSTICFRTITLRAMRAIEGIVRMRSLGERRKDSPNSTMIEQKRC